MNCNGEQDSTNKPMLLSATTRMQAARLKVEQTSASSVYMAMRGTLPSFGRCVAMISWMAKKPSKLTSTRFVLSPEPLGINTAQNPVAMQS